MGYNLPINGVYWGYIPFANHLLTSWDIQVGQDCHWNVSSKPQVLSDELIDLLEPLPDPKDVGSQDEFFVGGLGMIKK